MIGRAAVPLFLMAAFAVSGCAPREAYYRPAEGQAIGRDGLVGVRQRVPPGAESNEATAVAALSPLVRSERDGRRAEIGAAIELRNKRQETVTFLPEAVSLSAADGRSFRPAAVTRGGRRVEGPADVAHWHEATFVVRFDLDAEAAFETRTWVLGWSYRIGDKEYPQSTVFRETGPALARRSISGETGGLEAGASGYRATGAPFLMDLPFLGVLFRSTRSSASRSSVQIGPGAPAGGGGVSGEWWPLE
jgi:hypothetical protein